MTIFVDYRTSEVFVFVAHDAGTPMPAQHAVADTPDIYLPKAGTLNQILGTKVPTPPALYNCSSLRDF